jgi:beta-lactamase regulating signal transducer with metallopeptidase domain
MPLFAIFGLLQSVIRDSGVADTWLSFSQNAAPLFVAMLWQGAVVALGLTICLRLAPTISAAHRFGIWATGFATAVLLPSLSALNHATPGIMNSIRSDFVDTLSKPLLQLDARWGVGIAALWLLAVAVRAVNLAFQAVRLHELWKSAMPIKSGVGISASLAVPTKIWGRRAVEICTTNTLQRPSVIGFFAPRILIPDWLFGRLTPGEVEQIVLHEIEHLRRRDDWTNLIQKVGMVLFPLNPGLWWMERKLCLEREMACDEGVVRVTHAPRAYAACLATLAERGLQRRAEALSLGALEHRPELVRRVHGILRKKDKLNPAASIALMSAMSCALILGSLELSRSPQLVSFVQPPHVEFTHAAGPGQARLIHASSIHAPCQWVPQRGGTEAQSLAMQTKATFPVVRTAKVVAKPAEGSVRNSVTVLAQDVPKSGIDPEPPQRSLARIETYESLHDASGSEQWIMFTTVEQTQSSKIAGQQISDFAAKQNADRTTGDDAQSGQIGNVRDGVTVTRLILRVVPSDSLPYQQGAFRFRGSWFVIQL